MTLSSVAWRKVEGGKHEIMGAGGGGSDQGGLGAGRRREGKSKSGNKSRLFARSDVHAQANENEEAIHRGRRCSRPRGKPRPVGEGWGAERRGIRACCREMYLRVKTSVLSLSLPTPPTPPPTTSKHAADTAPSISARLASQREAAVVYAHRSEKRERLMRCLPGPFCRPPPAPSRRPRRQPLVCRGCCPRAPRR